MMHALFALLLALEPGSLEGAEDTDAAEVVPASNRRTFEKIGIAFDIPSPGWSVEVADETPEGKRPPKIVLDLPEVDGTINILVYEGEKLTLTSVAQKAKRGYLSLKRIPKSAVKRVRVVAGPTQVARDKTSASFAIEGTFDGTEMTGKCVVLPLSGIPNRKLVIMASGRSVAVQRILNDLDALIESLEIL